MDGMISGISSKISFAPPRTPCVASAPAALPAFTDRITMASVPEESPPKIMTNASDDGDVHILWGVSGHSIINSEAARDLPDDMPAFFRGAGDRLEALASQPDRWKTVELPRLDVINKPDHHIELEYIGDRTLPPERYTYLHMIDSDRLNPPGSQSYDLGVLPYAIAENVEKLTAEMALWRHEIAHGGEHTVLARQIADNVIYTAGLLGHYAGDASQPLHTSAHFDGWNVAVEPNPDHFTTRHGIHARFETAFVNACVHPQDVRSQLNGAQALDGDTLQMAIDFVHTTHQDLRKLYALDRDGKLDPSNPSDEGRSFVIDRLASGAQFLRDLWYTAWVRSEALAGKIQDPTMAANYTGISSSSTPASTVGNAGRASARSSSRLS